MHDASRSPRHPWRTFLAQLALTAAVATSLTSAPHAHAQAPAAQWSLRAPVVAMPDDLQRRLTHGRVAPPAAFPAPGPAATLQSPDERRLRGLQTAGRGLVGLGGTLLVIGGASAASCDTSSGEPFAGFGCILGSISVMGIGGTGVLVGCLVLASSIPIRRRIRLTVAPNVSRESAMANVALRW